MGIGTGKDGPPAVRMFWHIPCSSFGGIASQQALLGRAEQFRIQSDLD
jgi:hypothetical protein